MMKRELYVPKDRKSRTTILVEDRNKQILCLRVMEVSIQNRNQPFSKVSYPGTESKNDLPPRVKPALTINHLPIQGHELVDGES